MFYFSSSEKFPCGNPINSPLDKVYPIVAFVWRSIAGIKAIAYSIIATLKLCKVGDWQRNGFCKGSWSPCSREGAGCYCPEDTLLHTSHCTLHTANCTLNTEHCVLHTSHNTLQTEHQTLSTAHCMESYFTTVHCTMHIPLLSVHHTIGYTAHNRITKSDQKSSFHWFLHESTI